MVLWAPITIPTYLFAHLVWLSTHTFLSLSINCCPHMLGHGGRRVGAGWPKRNSTAASGPTLISFFAKTGRQTQSSTHSTSSSMSPSKEGDWILFYMILRMLNYQKELTPHLLLPPALLTRRLTGFLQWTNITWTMMRVLGAEPVIKMPQIRSSTCLPQIHQNAPPYIINLPLLGPLVVVGLQIRDKLIVALHF